MFYVYVHCAPGRGPFYVGKGKGRRAYNFSQRSEHHRSLVRKYGIENIQVVLIPVTSEEHAFRMEQTGIALLRLMGYDLVNQTDGGEGHSGYVKSAATKRRQSVSLRATMSTEDFKRRRSEASRRMHGEELRHLKSRMAEVQWEDPAIREARLRSLRGYRWINDGQQERRHHGGAEPPAGWRYGRVTRSID